MAKASIELAVDGGTGGECGLWVRALACDVADTQELRQQQQQKQRHQQS